MQSTGLVQIPAALLDAAPIRMLSPSLLDDDVEVCMMSRLPQPQQSAREEECDFVKPFRVKPTRFFFERAFSIGRRGFSGLAVLALELSGGPGDRSRLGGSRAMARRAQTSCRQAGSAVCVASVWLPARSTRKAAAGCKWGPTPCADAEPATVPPPPPGMQGGQVGAGRGGACGGRLG